MAKFIYTGSAADYPTLGFSVAGSGSILDGAASSPAIVSPPDARWLVYGGGDAETGITRYASPSGPTSPPEPSDGFILRYSDVDNSYVASSPTEFAELAPVADALEAAASGAVSTELDATLDTRVTALAADDGSDFSAGLSATFATGGEVRSKAVADTTDQTALIQAELDALAAFGGGTLLLPSGDVVLDGQLVMPNTPNGLNAQRQPSLTLRGTGGWTSGQAVTTPITGGTRIICNHQSVTYNDAKIVTRGLGRLTFEGITFVSEDPDDETPFIYTTNTTVFVQSCSFIGEAATSTDCKLDAIVLGGTKKPLADGYNDSDSAFQGYGSQVWGCYFDRIRRAAYGRSYCNHVVFAANFVEKTCGTNLAVGACVEFNGGLDVANTHPGDYCTGNQVWGNYLNGLGYDHQIKLVQTTRCVVFGNGSPDPQDDLISLVGLYDGPTVSGTPYPSYENQLYGNHCQETIHMFEGPGSERRNQLIGGTFPEGNVFDKVTLLNNMLIPVPADQAFVVSDLDGDVVFGIGGASNEFDHYGALRVLGNGVAASARVEVGDGTDDLDSVVWLNPGAGKSAQFRAPGWLFYDAASPLWFMRDRVNARMHATYTPGATPADANSEFNSNVTVQGRIRAKSPDGTLYQLVPPNGGGAATWTAV